MGGSRRAWSGPLAAAAPWIAGLLALWTVSRGASMPLPYGQSQWLLHYRFGFARRALAGTVVEPLLRYKSAAEVELILTLLAFGALLGLLVALGWTARAVLRQGGGDRGSAAVLWSAVFLLATSPWLVSLGNTVGFQDHLVALVTLAGLLAALRGRWLLLAALLPAGIALHELFLLAGLPVVLFATLLRVVRDVEGGASRRRAISTVSGLAAWGAVAAAVMLASAARLDPAAEAALANHVVGYGVFGAGEVAAMLEHVPSDYPGPWLLQVRHRLLADLLRPDIALAVYPPALAISGLAAWLLHRGGRSRLVLPLVGVVLSPLVLHAVAWDATRFATMTLLHAWVALVAVVLVFEPPRAPGRRVVFGVVAVASLLCVNSMTRPLELLGRQLDGDGPLTVRLRPGPTNLLDCRPVLPERSLSWTSQGAAFLTPSREGRSLQPRQGERGTAGAGHLVSEEFALDGDLLLVGVDGRRTREEAHVALVVDGVERHRAFASRWHWRSGHAWDVRAWRGRTAHLEIEDHRASEEGRIGVRGPCWFDPTWSPVRGQRRSHR